MINNNQLTVYISFVVCVFDQHFRLLEERKRSEKEGGSNLSDTLPRKKTTPTMTSQFTSATLGRSFPTKVHTEVDGLECI